MDAGSYSKKIINVVDKYSKMFYIRANKSADMFKQIREITDWQDVEIGSADVIFNSSCLHR